MDWEALGAFVAVAEAGSFTAGAARVGRPKSTVSRHVADLEASLGVRLLHRTTRRVDLTPSGRELLERVGPHVAALERVGREGLRAGPDGTLRITATPELGQVLLSEAVARAVTTLPSLSVEARLTADVVDLVGEGFDLALRFMGGPLPDDPHLTASRIGAVGLILVASPRYLARAGTPPDVEALAEHVVVAVEAMEGLVPVPAARRVRSDDMGFVRASVRAGAGVGIVPDFFVSDDLSAGELVRVLPTWSTWSGTVWLVAAHGGTPPARVTAFREILLDLLGRSRLLG